MSRMSSAKQFLYKQNPAHDSTLESSLKVNKAGIAACKLSLNTVLKANQIQNKLGQT